MHTPDWEETIRKLIPKGFIRGENTHEAVIQLIQQTIDQAREQERQLAQQKVLSEYELTREATIKECMEIAANMEKDTSGDLSDHQKGLFIFYNQALRHIVQALSDMTKHE